jgi:hypothetical protein
MGLTAQAINFAQSAFMGHRVSFNVPVDFMNEYFTWTRAAGEVRPTGRFLNNPNPVGFIPTFEEIIERCLGTDYTDLDGVAQGLNYSSDALDTLNDTKRDSSITNNKWDYTNLGLATPTAPTSTLQPTHYSANDLVMAFVLNKCFGSSSFDAWDIVYNLEDAFGMLTNADLAAAIKDSLQEEEDKAALVISPAVQPSAQNPGDDKGRVDDMFRSLLSIDPQRFYKDGTQIPGLFEANTDAAGSGNWCLGVGDKIEIPVRLYFRAPVTVLSVVDNAKNPMSATPEQVETVFIKGEGSTFDATNPAHVAAADRGNVMSIRLQLVCSAPAISNNTLATSEDVSVTLPLQVVNKVNLIFYKGPHYPVQTSIGVVVAGGTGPYSYAFTVGGTVDQATLIASNSPTGITLSSTGIFSFDPTSVNATAGRWKVNVTITDAASGSVSTDIYITVSSTGNTAPAPVTTPTALTSLASNSVTSSGFTVTWSGGSGATSYTYTLDGAPVTPSTNNGVSSRFATFTGLTPSSTYAVVVTAVNSAGSTPSTSFNVTTSASSPTTPPTIPSSLSSNSVTSSEFTVTWSGGSGATSYTYTLNGAPVTLYTDNAVSSSSATFIGLTPSTTYAVVVTAVNSVGSTPSTSLSVTTSPFTMPAPTSNFSTSPITYTLTSPDNYLASSFTQNDINNERILFGGKNFPGTFVFTATVNGGQPITIPTDDNNNNIVRTLTTSPSAIILTGTDPLYPSGSTVVITAAYTGTSPGVSGTVTVTLTFPDMSIPWGLYAAGIAQNSFTIRWYNADQAVSYNYILNGSAEIPLTDNGVSSKSATFTGLTADTIYGISVVAVNADNSTHTTTGIAVRTLA